MLQHLYSPSDCTLSFSPCVFKTPPPPPKTTSALNGHLSQALAGCMPIMFAFATRAILVARLRVL